MRSGGLNKKIKIQRKSTTTDSIGYPSETWKDIAEVWGELREEKGSEVLQNDRPISFRQAIVFLRYRSDVNVQDRIVVKGITWHVESLRTVEVNRRNEGLELVVRTND